MKFFSSQLITLLTVSATFAYPFFEKVSQGCKDAAKQYDECLTDIELSNLASVCATFNSEKCQNFKNNGFLLGLKECKSELQDKITYSNDIIEAVYIETKYRCTNDENGNICPINKYELENAIRTNYDQPVKDTCKSLACSNAYVEYINNLSAKLDVIGDKIEEKVDQKVTQLENDLNKMGDDIENTIENIFDKRFFSELDHSDTARRDYLISNKCSNIPALNSTKNGKSTSDATVITKSNTFIMAVILIIATLF